MNESRQFARTATDVVARKATKPADDLALYATP